MKDLLRMIVTELVDHPEQISISEREEGDKLILELFVEKNDMGKVIGKNGRIAESIRTIMKAMTSSKSTKVVVEIKEVGEAN